MKTINIEKGMLESLIVMASVVESRDKYTGGHIWRVSQYTKILASHIGLNRSEVFVAELGGLVHDIGKVSILDNVLNKESALTDTEYTVMKTHAETGNTMLQAHPLFELVSDSIRGHHVRYDGGGYPSIFSEIEHKQIPRIISLCDAFDAMTSRRSYRKPMDIELVKKILTEEKNKQFEAGLVDEFIYLLNSNHFNKILNHSDPEHELMTCMNCGPVITTDKMLKDGDRIVCPVCTGEVRAHKKNGDFEFEFLGFNETYTAKPDLKTAGDFASNSPDVVRI